MAPIYRNASRISSFQKGDSSQAVADFLKNGELMCYFRGGGSVRNFRLRAIYHATVRAKTTETSLKSRMDRHAFFTVSRRATP